MKKILSLLVLLVTFASCEEDVKFNNPAVQGLRNNELWRAAQYTASMGGDGSLIIQATNGFETLVLRTSSIDPGTIYELGQNEQNKASFTINVPELGGEITYQTGSGIGDGEIFINTDDTDLTQGFVSGTFWFNASADDATSINFQEGVFYRVPITAAP